jgi:glycosyltransferase involved in cell wall biosynthesis
MVSSRRGLEDDGWPPLDRLRDEIENDRVADVLALHDVLGIEVLDGANVSLRRRLPFRLAQALEIVRRRREFDALLTWGERDAIRAGGLMRLVPGRPAHVAILFWVSGARKAVPLRLVQAGIDRFVVPSPKQYRYALERIRLPPEKVVRVPWPVDTRFWRPQPADGDDLICAVGFEMRDWDTLITALRPLAIPCHIAAGNMRIAIELAGRELPAHVSVGHKSAPALRDLYARSRFVVVPLLPTDSDQGVTTCLEAMAMGRAFVCTESDGQLGVLEDGVNGIRVPPGDPAALRQAIERLWDDPELCARLGAAGRRLAEEHYALDRVLPQLEAVVGDAVVALGRTAA